MWFMNDIIEWLDDAAIWFLDLHVECLYSYYIPDAIADIFYELYRVFAHLAMGFYEFNELLEDWEDEIGSILSFSNIYSYFKNYFDAARDAWNWVEDAWNNIKGAVGDLIDIAKQGLEDLVDTVTSGLDSLRAEWDNFWTVTLPTLVSFSWLGIWWSDRLLEINELKETWVKELAPFWEGWQDVRDKVIDFFNDPLEWLLGKFTDWFLGPEE